MAPHNFSYSNLGWWWSAAAAASAEEVKYSKCCRTVQNRGTSFKSIFSHFATNYLHRPSCKTIQLSITQNTFSPAVFSILKKYIRRLPLFPGCQNGDVLVLKAFSDKCSGIHWFKTNFLASIQVNSCHKNGCAKFDWSVPATQFHSTPNASYVHCPQFTNHDFFCFCSKHHTQLFPIHNHSTRSQAQYPNSILKLGTSVWYIWVGPRGLKFQTTSSYSSFS